MSHKTRAGILASVAALTLTGAGFAGNTADSGNDKLIQDLQARIAELERKQGDNWLTEQRSEEIRGIVHDVLADADTRASLLSSGMTAGYDDGFVIGDAAGNFSMRVNGLLQARFVYSHVPNGDNEEYVQTFGPYSATEETIYAMQFMWGHQDNSAGWLQSDRHRSGFEIARARLAFSGHVLNPNWRYMLEVDFAQWTAVNNYYSEYSDVHHLGGLARLLDAYIEYEYPDTGLVFRVGQFKLPFLRETLVDARYTQTVERSLVDGYFTAGRSQGVHVQWTHDMFRITGAWSDGARRDNTGWWSQYGSEYAITARGEVLLAGNWNQFHEFRSPPGEAFAVMVGAAVHYEHSEYGFEDFPDGFWTPVERELLMFTVDASAKFGGWNLYGAYVYHSADMKSVDLDYSNHGFVFQGGYHLTPDWELFGRWESVLWDSDLRDDWGVKNPHVLTLGVNHYMFGAGGHKAKWTTDIGFAIQQVNFGVLTHGYNADPSFGNGKNGQVVFRTQLQLAF